MCVVVQHHLGKGAAAHPRCIPPAHGSVRGSTPFQRHPTVSPVDHSQGDFALPAPIDLGAFLPPRPLTISWRPGRELSRCPSLEPSHRPGGLRAPWTPDQSYADWMPSGAFAPLNPRAKGVPPLCNPDQPSAGWMPPARRRWTRSRGVSPPPEPLLAGPGDLPLLLHRTMHMRLPA
jgi:hypothetical protein